MVLGPKKHVLYRFSVSDFPFQNSRSLINLNKRWVSQGKKRSLYNTKGRVIFKVGESVGGFDP